MSTIWDTLNCFSQNICNIEKTKNNSLWKLGKTNCFSRHITFDYRIKMKIARYVHHKEIIQSVILRGLHYVIYCMTYIYVEQFRTCHYEHKALNESGHLLCNRIICSHVTSFTSIRRYFICKSYKIIYFQHLEYIFSENICKIIWSKNNSFSKMRKID